MTETRRLATILSLDVAGYSRAAEKDDAAAAASVRQLRSVISEIAAPFGGRIFNSAGDGFMLEFHAAGSAVQAAMALLQEGRVGARELPKIRIGVHLGDVIVEENGDLLGHGVNVAARLQALAEPGTALVSEPVRAQVRSAADLPFTPQGRVQLDKMSERLAVFALSPDGATGLGRIGRRRVVRAAAALAAVVFIGVVGFFAWRAMAPASIPRVAVLRFESLGSTEPYFAEEAAEELISELARIEGLEVTARASSFALVGGRATPAAAARELDASLVLTGSVRQSEERIRVQAQLVEAPSGRQIWAETFEKPVSEVFQLQRDIAVRVAQAVNVRATAPPPRRVDPAAYRLYLEGRERLMRDPSDIEDVRAIRDAFQAAVDRDPTFARAWYALASAENDVVNRAVMEGPPDMRVGADLYASALGAADHAIALDNAAAAPFGLKAVIYAYLGDWRQAAAMSAEAERRRGASGGYFVAVQLGYEEQAMRLARRGVQRDPLSSRPWAYLVEICRIAGDHACQTDAARRTRDLSPGDPVILGYLFYALAENREFAAARRVRTEDAEQIEPFLEINAPVNARYLAWMNGDGPPVPAAEIVNAVISGAGYVDPAVEMLVHQHAWREAALLLDRWGAAARPSLSYLYARDAAPLRRTPQFWALMDREGLTAYWRESGRWPDFCAREPVCPNR